LNVPAPFIPPKLKDDSAPLVERARTTFTPEAIFKLPATAASPTLKYTFISTAESFVMFRSPPTRKEDNPWLLLSPKATVVLCPPLMSLFRVRFL